MSEQHATPTEDYFLSRLHQVHREYLDISDRTCLDWYRIIMDVKSAENPEDKEEWINHVIRQTGATKRGFISRMITLMSYCKAGT